MDMQCVVLENPYEVKIETRPVPEPKAGEVLLKTLYGGICGGDIAAYKGNFFLKMYPIIQGHEFSARVERVDPGNKYGLKEGMLVAGLPYFGCGVCPSCQKGLPQVCAENKTIGALQDGAFRQYFTLPEFRVYDCTGLDEREAALIEPLCIGRHAVKRPGIQKGDQVLVIGAGAIGLVTAVMAKNLGAEVTISDIMPDKLKTAREDFDIPHIMLNDDPGNFVLKGLEHTDGHGYDIVLECVGLPSTFLDSLEVVMIGGKVVSVGVGKVNLDFDFNIIQKKHLEIYGSRNAVEKDFKETIGLLKNGELGDMKKMITGEYPFSDAAEVFDFVDKNNDKVIKALLKFA
jgi:2-desacetyl-2-hydroxyethyl bacteriochlorophyllide A dehydrogenase